MRQIKCPDCNEKCIKHGVLKSGSQRWFCKHCKVAFTVKINNLSKELNLFLNWLFSTDIQADMPGKGRTSRRKTAKFWSIWPLPPKVEDVHDVVYLDGIYLARSLCVLICCNDTHVLGWYVCRYEHVTGVQRSFFRKKTKSGLLVVLYALTKTAFCYRYIKLYAYR